MLKSYSSKAIASKARAMFGQSLTPDDYSELMKRTTVPEVAAYLRDNTHYAHTLEHVDLSSIHRGQLENLLRNERYERYQRLIHYDFSRQAGFYQYVYLWDEIEQIINLLRYIGAGSEGEYHVYGQVSPKFCSYDMNALLHARSYDDVREVLRNTPYDSILAPYVLREEEDKNKLDLSAIERDLTTYYYRQIFRHIDKQFGGSTGKKLRQLFLMRIDAENIASAYRLRRFFKSSPEAIKNCLLPFETPNRKLIERIATGDPGGLVEILKSSRMGAEASADDLEFIENLTLRLRHKYTKKMLRYSTYPPVSLVAYITQLEVELTNIINIIEAIRYQLAPADIAKILIV